MTKYWLNKKRSDADRKKISDGHKGQIPWNKNKRGIYSKETIVKMSDRKKAKPVRYWLKKHRSEDTKLKLSRALDKGGKLASRARRRLLGLILLNQEFKGSEGHHIDRQHVVFIPKELHRSVWHSLSDLETMEKINTKVICWLLGVQND